MNKNQLAPGVVHEIPPDFRKALQASAKARDAWNSITPLARNEWICWVISVKKTETRAEHIERASNDLAHGKRRPCCWPGCPHREKNKKK